MVGCGNKDIKETNGSQTMNSEQGYDTQISELDNYMTSIKKESDSIKKSLENEELT